MDRTPGRWAAGVPLRTRLLVVVLAMVAFALAGIGVATTLALRQYLMNRIDRQVTDAATMTAEHAFDDGRLDGPPPGTGHGPALQSAFYVRYTSAVGAVEARLELNGAPDTQSAPDLPPAGTTRTGRPFTVAAVAGGSGWRAVTVRRAGAGEVTVAVSLNEVDATARRLMLIEGVIAAGILVLLAVVAHVSIRSSLRPLVRVEHTAQQIAAGDLSRRVPVVHPRTEVGHLSAALNTMLGTIEEAFAAQQAAQEQARAAEAQAREAEAQAREAEGQARESESRMRRFVGDASHELRTPLTAIRGFAELYRHRGSRDGEAPALLDRIEQHATRMGLLVEDLLLLARLDQDRPLEQQPVDLLELATDAVPDARVTAPGHRVRLVAGGARRPDDDDPGEDARPIVLGDDARLRQILANLLANAYTHTPPGTEVTVEVGVRDGEAVLAVADTGPGMSEADSRRVFERFYRTDPSRTRAAGGSGLGLSIVDSIVRAHRGRVHLTTAPGKGTRLEVAIPLYRSGSLPGTGKRAA